MVNPYAAPGPYGSPGPYAPPVPPDPYGHGPAPSGPPVQPPHGPPPVPPHPVPPARHHCTACPMAGHLICPGEGYPRYCVLAERERRQADPRQHYWLERIAELAREAGQVVAARATVPPGTLVVRGHTSETGYGRMAKFLTLAIQAHGQPVAFDGIDGQPKDPAILAVGPGYDGPSVCMSSPWAVARENDVLFSMWESSRLPAESVATYNSARCVIVPCAWCAGIFWGSGVTAPIRVVPLGVDASVYHPIPNHHGDTFTVLSVNTVGGGGHRKAVPDLIAAFLEALGDREDASLRLKIDKDDVFDLAGISGAAGHPRIIIDRGAYSDAEMASLYNSASVYATATRAEGYGLPIMEAMTCGLPIIGPIHTAMMDYLTEDCAYPVEWTAEPARGAYYENHGQWYPARHDSLVAELRAAYDDRATLAAKGRAAAARAAEFTWAASAAKLLDVLREFGMVGAAPAKPVRAVAQAAVPVRPGIDPAVRDAVLGCPHRGPEAGLKLLPDEMSCCGGGAERTLCRAGFGARPGRVTLRDCLACQSEKLKMKDTASVGHGVFIGPLESCDRLSGGDFRVIHIWSDLNRSEGHLCKAVGGGSATLEVRWREGQSLDEMSASLDEIAEFAAHPGDLLVHCRAGSCRSPAVALVAKIARGCEAFDAIRDIGKGMYGQRHMYPAWFMENVLGILDWATARAGGETSEARSPEPALAGNR